jgi:DNA-binding LytR/AlgR family response regulator
MNTPYTALIAEDEPLLAAALNAELGQVWPELRILATVGDGHRAVQQALALQPDVLWFDIRMPGQSGLEAAAELVDAWPATAGKPFPQLVFVTAYDQYAVAAFETQAVDYLVKPVQRQRLEKCKQKLLTALAHRPSHTNDTLPSPSQLAHIAALLGSLGAMPPTPPNVATGWAVNPQFSPPAPSQPPLPLQVIQASHTTAQGTVLTMVPVSDVVYFEAADKYVRVLTAEREVLIRTPLKDLMPQLNPQLFWQIHRGVVVRVDAIAQATRDEAGRLWLHLHDRPERLAVSRLYAHLFKAM